MARGSEARINQLPTLDPVPFFPNPCNLPARAPGRLALRSIAGRWQAGLRNLCPVEFMIMTSEAHFAGVICGSVFWITQSSPRLKWVKDALRPPSSVLCPLPHLLVKTSHSYHAATTSFNISSGVIYPWSGSFLNTESTEKRIDLRRRIFHHRDRKHRDPHPS